MSHALTENTCTGQHRAVLGQAGGTADTHREEMHSTGVPASGMARAGSPVRAWFAFPFKVTSARLSLVACEVADAQARVSGRISVCSSSTKKIVRNAFQLLSRALRKQRLRAALRQRLRLRAAWVTPRCSRTGIPRAQGQDRHKADTTSKTHKISQAAK